MSDRRESYTTGATPPTNKSDLLKRFGDTALPEDRLEVGFDQYGRRIITQAGQTGAAYQRFLYVTPDGKNFSVLDYNQIVREVKKEFKNVEQLRTSLYRKGKLSEKDYVTKSDSGLSEAILEASNEQSKEIVDALTLDDNFEAKFTSMTNWINTRPDYVGGEGPSQRGQEITKLDAGQMIDAFTIDMLGREATPAEQKDFFERVSAEMKKAVVKRKTVGDKSVESGSFLDQEDYARIMAETIKPAIRGTSLEAIASGTGAIAQSITTLKTYAANYGIRLSTQEALDEVVGGLQPGGSLTTGKLDQQQQKIRNMAKSFYTNLGDSIDNGVSIKNLANQFANVKSQLLEVPLESVDVFDKDVQTALRNNGKTGVMSTTEFDVLLRNKPEWGKTKNARDEAAMYANDILRMFGAVG
jgi:hypothetical protein